MLRTYTSTLGLLAMTATASYRWSCPTGYSPVDIDVDRYTGQWYSIYNDKYSTMSIGNGCTMANYTLNDDGTITVVNTSHRDSFWWFFSSGWSSTAGSAVRADSGEGLVVKFGAATP